MKRRIFGRVLHGGTQKWLQEHDGREVVDFSASLNPFPPRLDWSCDPAAASMYPDDRYEALRGLVARTFGRNPEEVTVGNGSIELIRVFCRAVLEPGDRVRVDPPTFGEYALSAELCGARVQEGASAHAERIRFLCNPNNPDGALVPRDRTISILEECGVNGGYLFLDEAFIELSDPAASLADLRHPALFVSRSLTKAFAVPGLRFGYGFADPDLVERMEVLRLPWSVNAVAEQFAMAAIPRFAALEESRRRIREEREWLEARIRACGLTCSPSSANYLLLHLPLPAPDLSSCLLAHGILVRDCTSFGLPRSIRVAVRTREENRRLAEALTACLP
ncbi:MAG: histidinol-phosphate aminotransferase family protein [Methanomicrobiales archaeon]|nr:histidinol-phosphate aminotransferase family protein [Methanomicrobiales archaeon]